MTYSTAMMATSYIPSVKSNHVQDVDVHHLKSTLLLHASCILKISQLKQGRFFTTKNDSESEHLLESDSSSESDAEQPDSRFSRYQVRM